MLFYSSKTKLYYNFVVSVAYLSAFAALIEGLVKLSIGGDIYVKIIIQFIIFVCPLFICWFGDINNRFMLSLVLLIYLMALFPLREYGDVITYLQGIKVYFACLFYLPIVSYLSKNTYLSNKLIRHFYIILLVYAAWYVVEITAAYYYKDLAVFMRDLSTLYVEVGAPLSRPVGMRLDMQGSAAVMAIFVIINLLTKKHVMFILSFMILLMTGWKTQIIAAIIVSMLVMITRYKGNIFRYLLLIIPFTLISKKAVNVMTGLYQGRHISAVVMWERVIEHFDVLVLETGLIPKGLIGLSHNWTAFMSDDVRMIPIQMVTEVPMIDLYYQMGAVVFLLWLVVLYYPIFKSPFKIFKNDYMLLLFLTSFGFCHVIGFLTPFVFIYMLFFGCLALKYNKLPVVSLWPNPLRNVSMKDNFGQNQSEVTEK